jgi:RNA polymerase sigma factor (sigma-70 family)
MSASRVIDVLCALARAPDERPDGALVAAFVADSNEAAFAELVRRYGPMVFGACRRVLGHTHDAEDAFQAVFLVLARRAAAIRPRERVGNWLYGVAVRTALKARTAAVRRLRRHAAAARPEAVYDPADVPLADLSRLLDEELAQLADKYRTVIVLCDLNGQSRSAAARRLGWPEGTVAGRLAKARRLLAARLTRRGVTLTAVGAGPLLAGEATAAVPTLLAARAVAAATGSGPVPQLTRTLAQGVMRTMTWARLKLPVVLFLAGALAVGVVLGTAPTADPPPRGNVPPAKREGPKLKTWVWARRATLKHTGWLVGSVAYSRDGKQLVVGGTDGHVRAYDAASLQQTWEKQVGDHAAAVAYTADGTAVAVTVRDGVRFLDAATGKVGDLLEEKDSRPTAVAVFPDAKVGGGGGLALKARKVIVGNAEGYTVKTWLTWPNVSTIRLQTAPPGKPPADRYAVPLAVDPAGRRAVVTGPFDRATGKNVLWAWSAGSGAGNRLLAGHGAPVTAAAWSADGRTVVTADAAGLALVRDGQTFRETSRLALGGRVAAVAVTADGKRIAAAVVAPGPKGKEQYTEEVFVWAAAAPPPTPAPLSRHAAGGPFAGVAGLAFAMDGKELAAGFLNFTHLARAGELIGTVRVWRLAEKR